MKHFTEKLLILLLTLVLAVCCLAACDKKPDDTSGDGQGGVSEFVDYASTVKFDPNSGRAYTVVNGIKLCVDGDTTHFYVDKSVMDTGVLKARYLAINTPESTGTIEPWGKKASDFTKAKLQGAKSIIIESNDSKWNTDSTSERYLVWVWYNTEDNAEYRNLNLEILQEGLAMTSKIDDVCYYEVASKISAQSIQHKLHVYSKEKDPDFYYGSARPLTLKELKVNIEKYAGTRVSFEGVVTRVSDKTVYVEEYDEETGMYFGMQVYLGFSLNYFGEEIMTGVGNRVLVVGSVQYYEGGQTWQISDIKYNPMRPDHEDNVQLISEGHSASYSELDPDTLLNGKVSVEVTEADENGEEILVNKELDYGFLAMYSTASIKHLKITSLHTTDNEESSSNGAISITCEADDGTVIVVRTVPLKDASGSLVTESYFEIGSYISAKGIIDVYGGKYQLKVLSIGDISFD